MKPQLVNFEEEVDKAVGRRTGVTDPLSLRLDRKAGAMGWRKSFGTVK